MTTHIARNVVQQLSALVIGVAVLSVAGPLAARADAAPTATAPTLVLKYDQQSLGSDAGARALYQRIRAAANDVCPDSYGLASQPAVAACRKMAIERAVSQIHNPRLAELAGRSAARG